MPKNRIIKVQNIPITIVEADMDDYICITDMAAAKSEHTRELCKNFNNSHARFCNLFVKPDGQSQNLFLLCRGEKRKKKIQHFIRK